MARLSVEEVARSDAYHEGSYWLHLWSAVYTVALCWGLLCSRAAAALRDWAERVTRHPTLQAWLYAVVFIVAINVLLSPLTLYRDFLRQHQYGLLTQSLGSWMLARGFALVVNVMLLSPLVATLYWVFRRAARSGWLWAAAVCMVFLVLLTLILPLYIQPLFNTYSVLEDGALTRSLVAMAQGHGVGVEKIYQVRTSPQNTRIGAGVSGLLGSRRIVINDNLLTRCSPEEIRAVMAHEIGHYVLNHSYERLLFYSALLVVGAFLLRSAFTEAVRRWGASWRVRGIADPAGLPLLALLGSIYLFLLTPFLNSFVRNNETEADLFGLETARQPDAFAEVALKLSEYRKLDPGLLEEWIFHDHPSGRRRIAMAMHWKAAQSTR